MFSVAHPAFADGILPRSVVKQMPNQFEVIGQGELPGWARGWKLEVGPNESYNNKFQSKWRFKEDGTVNYTNVTKHSSGNVYSSKWALVRDKPSGDVGVASYIKDGGDGSLHARIFFNGGLQVAPTSQINIRWGWKELD